MDTFMNVFLFVATLMITFTIAAYIFLEWAAEKKIARIGDDNGSIEINGIWYVIKREGE